MKHLDSTYVSHKHVVQQILHQGSDSAIGIITSYLKDPYMTKVINNKGEVEDRWAALNYIATNMDNFASMLIMLIKDDGLRNRAIKYLETHYTDA